MKEITAKAAEWLKNRSKDPERKPFAKESEAFGAFISELLFDVLRMPFREAWEKHQKGNAPTPPVPDDEFRSLPESAD